ncbi:hypothetical protein [uncultured Agrococcus sp.]|uniref:hypothetical protein n=1 Tax=uncultured Agrococcus sp. TaxID=382258 RepID=UPI0025E96248|nr:hypothetical protein [uncultured Agrococcus sp.]
MRTIQYAMLLVITAAGVASLVMLLDLLPVTADMLPDWISELVPAIGSPASGWLIAALVTTIVIAALIAGWAERVLERRGANEEEGL